MTITTSLLQQNIKVLSGEVVSLTRLFEQFRGYVNRRFHEIDDRLNDMPTRSDLYEVEDRLSQRIDALESRMDRLEDRMDRVETLLQQILVKLS